MMMAIALTGAIAANSGSAKKVRETAENTSARQKARYYYLEGARAEAAGKDAEAYEYYRHARLTDPTYAEAASAYGQKRLIMQVDSLQTGTERDRSLAMLKPFVDLYPEDYEEAVYYAYVASKLDSIDEAIRVFERTYNLSPDRSGILIYLSDTYFNAGNPEMALDALSRYEKSEGKNPQITLKKIQILMHGRDTVAALNETSSLIESNPREPSFRILKGNMFEMMGVKDSVLAYYQQAEALDPGYGGAKMALADFYRRQGDSVAYDNKIYEALLAEDYGIEEKTGLLAEYLQKLINDQSDTGRGDYLFSVYEEQYPHEPQMLDLAARYNAAKGNYDKAIEKISYAIDLSGTNKEYWMQKMRYQISADQPKSALDTYDEAKKHLAPDDELKLMYATAAQIAEDYPRAIAMYSEIIHDLAPDVNVDSALNLANLPQYLTYSDIRMLSGYYTSIGDCYYHLEQLDKAFQAYDNAIELEPENAMALNNYAYFLVENGGDTSRAEDMSRRAIEIDGENSPTYLDTYAWILYKTGRYDEALKYQEAAIEKSDDRSSGMSELYDHYGDILQAIGQQQKAVDAWKKALEHEPDNKLIKKKINETK